MSWPKQPRWSESETAHFKYLFLSNATPEEISDSLKQVFGTERTKGALDQHRVRLPFKRVEPKPMREEWDKHSSKKRVANANAIARADLLKPEYISSLKKGDVVFYPGNGLVKCTGVEKMQVLGNLLETYVLQQIASLKTPVDIKIPKGRVAEKKIRKLSSKAALNEALNILTKEIVWPASPAKNPQRDEYVKNALGSGELLCWCELIGKASFRTRKATESDVRNGIRAMELLAFEYSVVFQSSYDTALEIARKKSGFKEFNERNMGYFYLDKQSL